MTVALHIVVATASNNVIGKDGKIPWHLPEDLQMFKRLTLHYPVLMGRKTFLSILNQLGKPLPKRTNLVLTTDKKFKRTLENEYPNVEIFNNLDDSLNWAKVNGYEKIFVVGGENVYRESLPQCEEIFLTQLDSPYEGDTFFPLIQWDAWESVNKGEWCVDRVSKIKYIFCHFRKKTPPG